MSTETSERQKPADKKGEIRKALAISQIALGGAIPTGVMAGEAVAYDQQARQDLVSIENIQTTEGGNLDAAGTALSLSEKTLLNPADIDILYKTTSVQVPLAQDLDSQALASRAEGELQERNRYTAIAGGMAVGTVALAAINGGLSGRKRKRAK